MARRRGKTIEDRAKQVRATGARLSAAKQALRDSLIVQRKAQNWPLEAIAAEAKVTVRTVSRVLEQREAVGEALLDRDPIDVVKQMAAQFEASIGDFEAMAYAYGETHPSAAVGAKKGADQAREKLLMLLQATGRMPRDLGGLGDLMGMRELASEMVDAVRAFKRGEADADHVEETFTRALGLGLSLRARVKRMTLRSIPAVRAVHVFTSSAGRAAVAAHQLPRTLQDVPAEDLVIERVEPSLGVGLGRPVAR